MATVLHKVHDWLARKIAHRGANNDVASRFEEAARDIAEESMALSIQLNNLKFTSDNPLRMILHQLEGKNRHDSSPTVD